MVKSHFAEPARWAAAAPAALLQLTRSPTHPPHAFFASHANKGRPRSAVLGCCTSFNLALAPFARQGSCQSFSPHSPSASFHFFFTSFSPRLLLRGILPLPRSHLRPIIDLSLPDALPYPGFPWLALSSVPSTKIKNFLVPSFRIAGNASPGPRRNIVSPHPMSERVAPGIWRRKSGGEGSHFHSTGTELIHYVTLSETSGHLTTA